MSDKTVSTPTPETDIRPFTRQEVAQILGFNPFNEASWPVKVIDDLINVEKERGPNAFMIECRKVMGHV